MVFESGSGYLNRAKSLKKATMCPKKLNFIVAAEILFYKISQYLKNYDRTLVAKLFWTSLYAFCLTCTINVVHVA